LVLVFMLALAAPAYAHQTAIKYVELTVDGAEIDVAFKVAPTDVTEPMHLPLDAKPTAAAAAATPGVAAYVARWLALAIPTNAGALACTPTAATATADADNFVVVSWHASCARAIDSLVADLDAFFAVDRKMEAIVRVGRAGSSDVVANVVRAGDSPALLKLGELSLLRWIRYGMNHIYSGIDHVSFVLALLLVVMLRRSDGRYVIKPFGATLRATATVVTAFTLAHSLTLIAAALGWLSLPSRVVESAIAASIAYTAAENIIRPDARWRYFLTFGFGLAHGLGFASALAVDLPPHGVVPPLLCFNVGVEIGQLTIVAIALPLFYSAARWLGAERYRRWAMPVLSAVIFAFGSLWFVERAFAM
jgi:HupE / UreJ protein